MAAADDAADGGKGPALRAIAASMASWDVGSSQARSLFVYCAEFLSGAKSVPVDPEGRLPFYARVEECYKRFRAWR